jgi:lysophospholipase L1-like esterase
MDIREKLKLDYEGLIANGPINIVFLGDSVTHGAFSSGEFDYDAVYHRVFARMVSRIRAYVPVNAINSGIGATNARQGLERIERDVIAYHPDLVVVCFGLNDVNGDFEKFKSSLAGIFSRLSSLGIETIFMTPNMLNTYPIPDPDAPAAGYSHTTATKQTNGMMDTFMDAAREIAGAHGVKVADAYAEWKKLSETCDTTLLLANRINHPTKEMHKLFAKVLFKTVFGDTYECTLPEESAMYRGADKK